MGLILKMCVSEIWISNDLEIVFVLWQMPAFFMYYITMYSYARTLLTPSLILLIPDMRFWPNFHLFGTKMFYLGLSIIISFTFLGLKMLLNFFILLEVRGQKVKAILYVPMIAIGHSQADQEAFLLVIGFNHLGNHRLSFLVQHRWLSYLPIGYVLKKEKTLIVCTSYVYSMLIMSIFHGCYYYYYYTIFI